MAIPEAGGRGARRRWVIKVGSALVTRDGRGLNVEEMQAWVDQMVTLRGRGIEVVLVSSGAIAEGMRRLGYAAHPRTLSEQQALAAVGQMGLVQAYESCFKVHGVRTAQVLLTHEDIANRTRYLNARSTLVTLLRLGVIAVINENDTVATAEIRVGENDTLAGLVANLIEAERLVILTDQGGLYTADPRHDPGARLVARAEAGDPALDAMAGDSGAFGRGGMKTKLRAARLAARSGSATVIASGREPQVLVRLADGESIGTLLGAGQRQLAARKRWLAGQPTVRGRVVVDAGAARVLARSGGSLLAVGIRAVEGAFGRGDIVACVDDAAREVARGLVNYDAGEVRRIMGLSSAAIAEVLGYIGEPEVIHRDNLVLMDRATDR